MSYNSCQCCTRTRVSVTRNQLCFTFESGGRPANVSSGVLGSRSDGSRSLRYANGLRRLAGLHIENEDDGTEVRCLYERRRTTNGCFESLT